MRFARMAESVDALVSNTNDSNVVPVRPRLRVQSQSAAKQQIVFFVPGSSSGCLGRGTPRRHVDDRGAPFGEIGRSPTFDPGSGYKVNLLQNSRLFFLCRGLPPAASVAEPRAVMSTTAALPSVKSDVVRHSTPAPGTKSICCKTADCFFVPGSSSGYLGREPFIIIIRSAVYSGPASASMTSRLARSTVAVSSEAR